MSNYLCEKITDCSSCEYHNQTFVSYRYLRRKEKIENEVCKLNTIFFLVSGALTIDSEEFPNQTVREGEFLLHPMGSAVEMTAVTDSEMIIYIFDYPPHICSEYFDKSIDLAQSIVPVHKVMSMKFPLRLFVQSLKTSLSDDLICQFFLRAKQTEFYCLLNSYYTKEELSEFYAPIFKDGKTFRYFILQNYKKMKDVEEFAFKAGYSVSTFRRIFKEVFGMPAYQWMLKMKCENIKEDLSVHQLPVKDLCAKYGFDSLSNFSHFCKSNFGMSPRLLRSQKNIIEED